MKKVFKLEGLDCAHCAAKIEEKISKLEGVKSVVINFMTTKMTLESIDENFEEIVLVPSLQQHFGRVGEV